MSNNNVNSTVRRVAIEYGGLGSIPYFIIEEDGQMKFLKFLRIEIFWGVEDPMKPMCKGRILEYFGELEGCSTRTVFFQLIDLVPTEQDGTNDGQDTKNLSVLGHCFKIHGHPSFGPS